MLYIYLIWVIGGEQMNGFDLGIKLHENGLDPIPHGVTGVVNIVKVLAKASW